LLAVAVVLQTLEVEAVLVDLGLIELDNHREEAQALNRSLLLHLQQTTQ
jgi:hypothetical protein